MNRDAASLCGAHRTLFLEWNKVTLPTFKEKKICLICFFERGTSFICSAWCFVVNSSERIVMVYFGLGRGFKPAGIAFFFWKRKGFALAFSSLRTRSSLHVHQKEAIASAATDHLTGCFFTCRMYQASCPFVSAPLAHHSVNVIVPCYHIGTPRDAQQQRNRKKKGDNTAVHCVGAT